MLRALWIVPAVVCGCVFAGPVCAQSQQSQPAPATQQPAQQDSNPFPGDATSAPVIPTTDVPAAAPDVADYSNVSLAGADADPVRSPDDAPVVPDAGGSSSSDAGMDQLLKPPPDQEKSGHRRLSVEGKAEPVHHEGPKEDESVGSYYLDQKNWKAALSRFESAMVMDPENPDVYWGLAEAQRHLGDYGAAKSNYLKVVDYDPDSRHGKDARKLLKEPELAHAAAVSSNAAAPQPQQ